MTIDMQDLQRGAAHLLAKGSKAWPWLLPKVCKARLRRPVEHLQDVARAVLALGAALWGLRSSWLGKGSKAGCRSICRK